MSPFCRGSTLAACTSSQAEELRLWILTQAAAGASRDEVESQLIARFGDEIRSIPRAEGWGATTFAIPLAGLVLGGGVVAFALRRMVRSERDESPDLAPVAVATASSREDLARRIDAELEG
jgi:cytochrome c-type biogenesis protein CcmH/NrfF